MNKNNFKTCIAGVEQCSRAGQLQLITSSHVSARGSEWEKEGRKKNERERERMMEGKSMGRVKKKGSVK